MKGWSPKRQETFRPLQPLLQIGPRNFDEDDAIAILASGMTKVEQEAIRGRVSSTLAANPSR